MGTRQLSSDVIKDIIDILLKTLPQLILGAGFGWIIGSLRSEFFDRIFDLEKRFFEKMTSDLKLFHNMAKTLNHAMMDDRFEFVDVRKEGNGSEAPGNYN